MLIPSLLVLLLSHRLSFPLLVDPTPSSVVSRLDDAFSTLVSDDYFFEHAPIILHQQVVRERDRKRAREHLGEINAKISLL